jgi:aromatic ring-opening dioxygenase catalytic subunit (LigB family)
LGTIDPGAAVTLAYATYVPNAPFLIAPAEFGGAGAETVEVIRGLRVEQRFHPRAIIVSSPHWNTRSGFRVSESPRPRQIYDFSGFPPSLSAVRYEPAGNPTLARALVAAAKAAGVRIEGTTEWGLDHGAWAPLLHLAPGATIPTIPLSISNLPPEAHIAFGQAIRPVIDSWPEPIVFVGTGSIAHNFDRYDPRPEATWPEGERIEGEILELIRARDDRGLVAFDRERWNTLQPEGNLGPLFTLLAVVPPEVPVRVVSRGSAMGGFGLSVVDFTPGKPDR